MEMIIVKSLFNFLKKTWGLFLILFIAPVIVVSVFAIKEYVFHEIDLSAGEWSNLMGSIFSYWGTVLLGTLAFWQNDRILQLEERNLEIQEVELRLNNRSDFVIDSIYLSSPRTNRVKMELEPVATGWYKQKYQCQIGTIEDTSFLTLEVELKNISGVSAYNVETYESIFDIESGNTSGSRVTLGARVYKEVEKDNPLTLTYYISFRDIKPVNGIKYIEYNFNLNYKNLYHHYFYNFIHISVAAIGNSIIISAAIREQCYGKEN